jgi:glycosyltransferase involved in cell wall biosynthesis
MEIFKGTMENPSIPQYSVVVPFYNEQDSVMLLYERIVKVMQRQKVAFEMVFVDDGSLDQTARILESLAIQDPRIVFVKLRKNFGQTAALKAGFDHAGGEIIISLDGDLQHDPEEIPFFLKKMEEGYDIVSGWRQERKDAFWSRRIPSRIANWLICKLSGVEIHDFGTTFKAYRRDTIQEIPLYGELHRFIPALASWRGATVAEIPINNPQRKSGKSNYGLSRTFHVLFDLMSIKYLLDFSTRPLHFFGTFGLLGTGIGGCIGLFLAIRKLCGVTIMIEHGPLLLMSMLLIIGGIQFLLFGLLGEMLSRTYYESQSKPIYSIRFVKRHGDSSRRGS